MTAPPPADPIAELLAGQGLVILDGALATELERRGADLSDELWSARLLRDAPERILEVHLDYLRAGADCLVTASYQATIEGFVAHGATAEEAEQLVLRAVELACEARAELWRDPATREGRAWPLVAASVGPYGAFLADGSEYRGDYGLSHAELVSFHRRRWHLLASSQADLLACETLPSAIEARALLGLLRETPDRVAWFSFSCRDERHLADGSPLREIASRLDDESQVVAIGVNCVAPEMVLGLVAEIRRATDKPIVVYPNSGERWDPTVRSWRDSRSELDFAGAAVGWREAGARVIGGCCRTRPTTIAAVRRALLGDPPEP